MCNVFYTALLWKLELPRRHPYAIKDVLTSLGAAIQESEDEIHAAEQSRIKLGLRDDPWADDVLDRASTSIETLLGYHNVGVVIQSVQELGIETNFEAEMQLAS